MFGYVNVNRETLSAEEKETYQSYYCGLCRRLKENCGAKGQMLLAYDMTFLVVLLTGLYELSDESESFTCALHPAKKRIARSNAATEYAADMNLILGFHNLIDDWNDDKNLTKKRLAEHLSTDYEVAVAKYPRQLAAVRKYLAELDTAEKANEPSLDIVAGISGEILSEIFAWRDDEWRDELKCLGFYLGKFIYLMDAYEDLAKDRKSHAYNPLIALSDEKTDEEYETLCRCFLTCQMSEAARSFERLPVLLHAGLIRNVLYSGVWSKYEILQKKKKKNALL